MSTIMIVEDTAQCREPLVTLFQKLGHTALPVCNGVEALRMLEKQPPDMILLDIKMPEMDGLEFLRTMRSRSLWKDIPVVVLTGMADQHTMVRAAELGVTNYLVKAQFGAAQLEHLEKQLDLGLVNGGSPSDGTKNENDAALGDADELSGCFEPPPTKP